MEKVTKYCLDFKESRHTLLKMPSEVSKDDPNSDAARHTSAIFNILMADASGSMSNVWNILVNEWSENIVPLIKNNCKVFVFGNDVKLVREDSANLIEGDFIGSGTNLTDALNTIEFEINECTEEYARVFLITDGHHNSTDERPESTIKRLRPPPGKTIEVYVLAIGRLFPVQYSIDIRSLLHNGPTNIPYIFWAKNVKDISFELASVAKEISKSSFTFNLSVEGSLLPGTETTNIAFPSDWIYIQNPPEELNHLSVTSKNGSNVEVTYKGDINYQLLAREIFSQWNSVILRKHRKNENFDHNIFEIMENQYNKELIRLNSVFSGQETKLKKRLHLKTIKTVETEFRTLINQSKSLIDIENEYRDEMELAELLLKTTIAGKYGTKGLKYKGYSSDEYNVDKLQFGEIYEKLKSKIMNLPSDTDDCCRITAASTITDLQDPIFSELLELNKFEFLNNFTVTGIPVLTAVKDSTEMNPWTIHIKNILLSPYEVLSQRALEFGAETVDSMDKDKSILLQQNDESSRFNAVIPIFPKGAVEILKPLLTSKLFSMCCTFSISKNVLIIDYECHIAALACVWLKTIHDYPKSERPEFIIKRIECIDEAAQIYKGRKGLKNYAKCLVEQPQIALMTDSGTTFQESKIRCESITKPAFLLHAYKDELKLSSSNKFSIIKTTLIEFIGRSLSHFDQLSPFTYLFMEGFSDSKKKSEQFDTTEIVHSFQQTGDELLIKLYYPELLSKYIKQNLEDSALNYLEEFIKKQKIQVDMKKIENLKNSGSCGDVSWAKLKSWAREMEVSETEFDKLFSTEMIMMYIVHVLKYKGSKLRMEKPIDSVDDIRTQIMSKIINENLKSLLKDLLVNISKLLKERWEQAYYAAHEEVVSPMTKDQIIAAANEVGVKVSSSNFDQIYKYRENVGLVRNACMCVKCPHYLQPHNTFNQHISVERRTSTFPHNLHNITASNVDENVAYVKNKISSKHKKAKKVETNESENNVEISEDAVSCLIDKYASFHSKSG